MDLTDTQKQVIRELFTGKNFTLIAKDLGFGITKITEIVASIYNKYDVNDRIQLNKKVYLSEIIEIYKELIVKDKKKLIIVQGDNGSGKSRLLKKLLECLQYKDISYFDCDYVSDNALTKLLPDKNEKLDYLIIDFPIDILERYNPKVFNKILNLDCTKILISVNNIENTKILEIASIYKL